MDASITLVYGPGDVFKLRSDKGFEKEIYLRSGSLSYGKFSKKKRVLLVSFINW